MEESDGKSETIAGGVIFRTTHWSVVIAAGDTTSPASQEALSKLCKTYWYPVYSYVRRRGYNPHDAQDLTQEFFSRLLRSHYFSLADRKKGKFRSFLISSLKNFLSHEWDKAHAQKRGGGLTILSLNDEDMENRYKNEPSDNITADLLYDRNWALALIDQVIQKLKKEYEDANKTHLFKMLEPALTGEAKLPGYSEIGEKLGMTEGAVKVAVFRLRKRFGELLREEIANTVSSPEEIEDELRSLLDALKSG
ncbi:MAG: RNA polymerase sigma factor [Verrucomicrobiae bacterium]|nr:RNA polymerase sigma factor [Verrucomicrobiae bacterium]